MIIQADARALPLPDASVDLIVTSPPYYALRSYTDGGQHYAGQIGSEPTPQEWLANLLDCTREMVRVLKPSGSIWVDLGDKYAGGGMGGHSAGLVGTRPQGEGNSYRKASVDVPAKSLMLLPERYRIACVDQLGLIARAVVVWSKPNGLPESVTDRVRRSHEDWVHLTKAPRYFAAVDEIREPHTGGTHARRADGQMSPKENATVMAGHRRGYFPEHTFNALGKLPGSVWTIPTEPLTVPEHLGVDHFAAFPTEWPRRIILGWSPSGICLECGEGRRPAVCSVKVTSRPGYNVRDQRMPGRHASGNQGREGRAGDYDRSITGYACACTPYTDHPERRQPSVTPGRALGRGHQDNAARAAEAGSRHHGNDWPDRQPTREYHFDRWTPAPTRPSVILDPFGGTGTTALVAQALGRIGISVDMSADYCRLARWRTSDPGERAKAMRVDKPAPVHRDQLDLFSVEAS